MGGGRERKRELIRGPLQAVGCLHAQGFGDVFTPRIRGFLADHPRLELGSASSRCVMCRDEYVESERNREIHARHRSCQTRRPRGKV